MQRNTPNPFVYSRALAPREGIERTAEVDALVERAAGGHSVVLYAARRMGKTSLLKQVRVAADGRGIVNVLVDLSDVLSVADVAVRLEQAFRELPGRLKRIVDRELGALGITSPIGGITFQRRGVADPIATVHSLLEVPARIAERSKSRVLLILDEFQALIELKGLDGVFRSHLQHQPAVSCVFSGSEPSLLRVLFEDRARPLYGQAEQMRLDRLPFESAYDFVTRSFAETGKDVGDAATAVVELAEGHPQRLMLLAHLLWEHVSGDPATVADARRAYDAAIRAVGQELRFLWDSLTANERRVLAAVASGLSPYEARARALAGLASASSAQRAVESLLGRAVLDRADDELRIVDPLFARWIRLFGGARPRFWVLPEAGGGFVVTDGPSQAYKRSRHDTLEEAEAAAHRYASDADRGADVMVYDTDDPNDLPDWAIR